MAAKSPTSLRSREIIGGDLFSQRREVFDKHDTVFLPPHSPVLSIPRDLEPIITSNHGKTTTNFKRNSPAYSSMKETKHERSFEFRARKYSDNFTSELNQSDDVDYRSSMTERTRKLSKLRREFLKSNLHEPNNENNFVRNDTRASLPINRLNSYKIVSPNLYKFPFAEPPCGTPPPIRKVTVDLGPATPTSEVDGTGKENHDPGKIKHQSLPNNTTTTSAVDKQKLFEELIKRYSPQRQPIDWKLPPTRPRVVASIPKSISSATESTDSTDNKASVDDLPNKSNEDVFNNKENTIEVNSLLTENRTENHLLNNDTESTKTSIAELEEKNDRVPELPALTRQISLNKRPSKGVNDLNMPDLIQKMSVEGETLEKHYQEKKKPKNKRSLLDKILRRKKHN